MDFSERAVPGHLRAISHAQSLSSLLDKAKANVLIIRDQVVTDVCSSAAASSGGGAEDVSVSILVKLCLATYA